LSTNIEKFEDLNVWQEGILICTEIYEVLKDCKDFGVKDQVQRSAVSIPSNIAEGFERNTNKDFIRFLYYAKSSAGELRTQLYLCGKIGLIPNKVCEKLIENTRKISAMIYNLIKVRYNQFN
jgi:four helix bundle protein